MVQFKFYFIFTLLSASVLCCFAMQIGNSSEVELHSRITIIQANIIYGK